MSATMLKLTARDPIVARDGRPFGAGQGNRMRGVGWPLPSVVAGSFRTALVKANLDLDFNGGMPQRLMNIEVAGVFPTAGGKLYFPAPNDCVWNGETKQVHAARPLDPGTGGGDFPSDGSDLRPVVLSETESPTDFKPRAAPAWWPIGKLTDWLLGRDVTFDAEFLETAKAETRDHVHLDANTGAAAEGELFTTVGLNATHLPRFGLPESAPFSERFVEIALGARVTISEPGFEHVARLDTWHPLGGERRLVHWQRSETVEGWACPDEIRTQLAATKRVRMVLTTPAIFQHGWRPDWLDANTLTGNPNKGSDGPKLKLVGVSSTRWKAVSGWSLAKINATGQLDPKGRPGPKAIRRMVPAGSVYFFAVEGNGQSLADGWLRSVSDLPQDRNDGFGLAVWGIW